MHSIPTIAPKRKISFQKTLLQWHTVENTRQMPWKGETDPYKIWLSEIILQQTRVQQGWEYYQRFITNYPTIKELARATDDEVFRLWEGLGYYTRCKNLLATARFIAYELDGVFPDTQESILALKGVGPYTAAAIASFAFGLPYAVVDGNVLRVLSRWFGIDTPVDSSAGKLFFAELAAGCLATDQPAAYNQAIMDFGATVCTPANPQCGRCPLQQSCIARVEQRIDKLPVKSKFLQKTTRWFTYFIISWQDKVMVHKRMEKGIWQNLHEFFLEETGETVEWNAAMAKQFLQEKIQINAKVETIAAPVRQLLTHQTIYITFVKATALHNFQLPEGYFLIEKKRLPELAFPKTLRESLSVNSAPTLLF